MKYDDLAPEAQKRALHILHIWEIASLDIDPTQEAISAEWALEDYHGQREVHIRHGMDFAVGLADTHDFDEFGFPVDLDISRL